MDDLFYFLINPSWIKYKKTSNNPIRKNEIVMENSWGYIFAFLFCSISDWDSLGVEHELVFEQPYLLASAPIWTVQTRYIMVMIWAWVSHFRSLSID